MATLRIGTSGWHYRHWLGTYYPADLPAKRMLSHYSAAFDTVEINNSFYKLPSPETLTTWAAITPPGFCFAFKASRFLTHMKKLKDPAEPLARLFARTDVLAEKLGPILFQLPPHWHCNHDRLAEFLALLPANHRYAMEFRDPSWFNQQIFDLLSRHEVAFCLYELAGLVAPEVLTAPFTYVRLHGPGGKYQGRYGVSGLQPWADKLRGWARTLEAAYVYFDNDEAGHAPADAATLRQLLAVPQGRLSA